MNKANHPTGKYFLYARKSTEDEDRQVLSIESQIEELQKLAESEGITICEILMESKSAKAPGRPVFSKMMERVYSGEAQGIICWKLDRLARNPVDGGQISWALQQGVIQHIQTFGRSFYPTDNVLMMSVEFGMANQFVRDLSIGVKRGLDKKIRMGWASGLAPAGYLNTPDREKGYKIIVEDPERFPIIRKAWDLILTGRYTIPQVLEIVNETWGYRTVKRKREGGGPLSRSGLYRLFTNPFYAGILVFKGEEHPGSHKPMITLDEYDAVQQILGKKGKPRPKKNSFPYSGAFHCSTCDRTLTPEKKSKRQKNGNHHEYTYYSCKNRACDQTGIEAKELDRQVIETLSQIRLPQEFCDWAMEIIREENKKEWEGQSIVISNLQRQYSLCIKKLDGLIDMRAAGEIDETAFTSKRAEISSEKDRTQRLLNDADHRATTWLSSIENALSFAKAAQERFATGSPDDRKAILYDLGSNLCISNKKLDIQGRKCPMEFLTIAPEVQQIMTQFEPHELLTIESKNRAFDPVRCKWLSVVKEVRTFLLI